MLPFLLPLALILYGEFSRGVETRFTSRLIFYTYLLSIVLPLYVTSSSLGILLAIGILIFGLGYVILNSRCFLGKFFTSIVLITSVLNYTSIYLQDYTFLLSIPYYAEYSNILFRECLILGITSISIAENMESKDFKLEMFITSLWLYEHFVI